MKKAINMRLNDSIIDIIEKENGDTFTKKFENLVLHIESEKNTKLDTIKQLNNKIETKQEKLKVIDKLLRDCYLLATEINRNTY